MVIHYNRQKGVNYKIIFLYSLDSWSGECVSYKQSEESSGNVAFPSSTVSKVVWCGLFLAFCYMAKRTLYFDTSLCQKK